MFRIKPNPNQPYTSGKVWGVYFWNHRQIGKETSIGGTSKRQWKLDAEQPEGLSADQLRSNSDGKNYA
jgi:hypothetical protein